MAVKPTCRQVCFLCLARELGAATSLSDRNRLALWILRNNKVYLTVHVFSPVGCMEKVVAQMCTESMTLSNRYI